MLNKCPKCGKEVPNIAQTCPNCGTPVTSLLKEDKVQIDFFTRYAPDRTVFYIYDVQENELLQCKGNGTVFLDCTSPMDIYIQMVINGEKVKRIHKRVIPGDKVIWW